VVRKDDAAGGGAAGPVQPHVDEFAVAPDADGDLVEDRADDLLNQDGNFYSAVFLLALTLTVRIGRQTRHG
jgi:hypothetical protein